MIADDDYPLEKMQLLRRTDMKKYLLTFPLLMLLAMSPVVPHAQAWVGLRVGIGLPLYVGPGPYYYSAPYSYYAPTYPCRHPSSIKHRPLLAPRRSRPARPHPVFPKRHPLLIRLTM